LEDLPVVSCGSNLVVTIVLSFTPVMITSNCLVLHTCDGNQQEYLRQYNDDLLCS